MKDSPKPGRKGRFSCAVGIFGLYNYAEFASTAIFVLHLLVNVTSASKMLHIETHFFFY